VRFKESNVYFLNQNGGKVEMGNGNPVGVVETGVSFKDLCNPSKDTQDSDMDEDKVKLEKYESFFTVVIT
jgi:hypothetical protein